MAIKYFVTRHNGAILWARDAGIRARKITQDNFDVNIVQAGDIVMGTLPVHLAGDVLHRGGHYWHLSMEVPLALRGKELTAEQMRACGARLEEFRVLPRGLRSSPNRDVAVPTLAPEAGLIHIVIASEQVLPNLLTALALPCAGLHILVSNFGPIRQSATLLGDIVTKHFAAHKGFQVIEHKLGNGMAYAELLAQFVKARDAVRERTNGQPLLLNITGGTKPMALAATEAFAGIATIAYLNVQTNQIECIEPAYCAPYPVSYDKLSCRLYLQAHHYDVGEDPASSGPDVVEMESRRSLTGYLARNARVLSTELLVRGCLDFSQDGVKWPHREENADRWEKPSTVLARLCEMGSAVDDQRTGKTAPAPLFVRWTLPKGSECTAWGEMLKRLQSADVIEVLDDGRNARPGDDPTCAIIDFRFKSAACARYVGGTWVEEFAVLTARAAASAAGLDPDTTVYAGMRLFANHSVSKAKAKPEINELDLVIYHGGRMLIIEAKAGGYSLLQNSQSVLNKLDRLKRSVGGPYGAAWLLCARPLDETRQGVTAENVSSLLERARLYGIECHAADDLKRFHESISAWMNVPVSKGWGKTPPVWSKDEWRRIKRFSKSSNSRGGGRAR